MLQLMGKLAGGLVSGSGAGRARKLAEQGRYLEAVRAAEGANDLGLAREVLVWRHRAVAQARTPQPRSPWPPLLADPFPGSVDRIPEITPGELTPDVLGGAIQHHGSLIVRGLFSQEQAGAMIAEMDRVYEAKNAWFEGRSTDESVRLYAVNEELDHPDIADGRMWAAPSSAYLCDSAAFVVHWAAALRSTGVLDAVTGYLGETPVLSKKKTTLYRVPPGALGQWHQDGAFLGVDTRTVNMWTALTPCGREAPGLDIVPWRLNNIAECGTEGAAFNWSVGEGVVAKMAQGRDLACPEFGPGDAILFDHMCLHRTAVRPEMTKTRYAIESWMFTPSTYPSYLSLVV